MERMVTPEPEPEPEVTREITGLLVAVRNGTPDAMDRLFPLVYGELRRVAHRRLRAEATGHTLGTTALVHEAYLKLVDQTHAQFADRTHFFAVAARAMRRILVDYARQHKAARRGGGRRPLSLDVVGDPGDEGDTAARHAAIQVVAAERADELVALDEALERLEKVDQRQAKVVELRFYGELSEEEIAEVLGITARTVRRDWTKAREWLYHEVRRGLA
jgi:RNA polymerase sigma factor (TIGR02999 family)